MEDPSRILARRVLATAQMMLIWCRSRGRHWALLSTKTILLDEKSPSVLVKLISVNFSLHFYKRFQNSCWKRNTKMRLTWSLLISLAHCYCKLHIKFILILNMNSTLGFMWRWWSRKIFVLIFKSIIVIT